MPNPIYTLELTLNELKYISSKLKMLRENEDEYGGIVPAALKSVQRKTEALIETIKTANKEEVKSSIKTLADMLKDKGLK